MTLPISRTLLIALAVTHAGQMAPAAVAAEDGVPTAAAETYAWAKDAFAQIDCRLNGRNPRPLKPHDQSILRWSNPEVGGVFGDCFLFTSDRRPAALVALYAWHRPGNVLRFAEFLSLSEAPVMATAGDDVVWNAGPGNLVWKNFEPRVIPATSAPARLRQMRGLVARLEVVLDHRHDNPDRKRQTLRKLMRPLFRYDNVDEGLLDGAVFAFVASTDPDALVLVEARENARAEKSWYYAVARLHCSELTVMLDGSQVAKFPYMRDRKFDLRRPYCVAKWPAPSGADEADGRAGLDAAAKTPEN